MNTQRVYTTHDLNNPAALTLEQFNVRFIAEGDSWFTIGSLTP